uniref:Protein kinase domain-containing protein n=1 Tax=Guillardia theta TaxID=55529 RepID=A0A7S4U5W3_GUITH|mmetsp:Transcript_40755/g.128440  ORF Transcript_40755/g.128440 Transcript_40755/m.128440 type:complete len:896 (+) Transcript_40755:151-2838(+)
METACKGEGQVATPSKETSSAFLNLDKIMFFGGFHDREMEQQLRNDLDDDAQTESHVRLWGVVIMSIDCFSMVYLFAVSCVQTYLAQDCKSDWSSRMEVYLNGAQSVMSAASLVFLTYDNIPTRTRFRGVRWLLRMRNVVLIFCALQEQLSRGKVEWASGRYLHIHTLVQVLCGHIIWRSQLEHHAWILSLNWMKPLLRAMFHLVMFKTELQRTDALMFLKKIFSKHEKVPMSADDIYELVTIVGFTILSFFVLHRSHMSVRRNWLLMFNEPRRIIGGVVKNAESSWLNNMQHASFMEQEDEYYTPGDVEVLKGKWQAQSFTYGNSGSPTGAGSMKHGVYGEDWHMTDVVLGSGTYGCVYKGLSIKTGEELAVKTTIVKRKNLASGMTQLERELKMLERFSHKNIVQYKGACFRGDQLYLFLEFCHGGSLSRCLEVCGAFNETLARAFARDVTEGLAYLHSHGIVHRDVKSGNCLLSHEGILKLADFGAAQSVGDDVNQELQGTPGYLAPEVMRKTGMIRQSDIWSLGACVMEMLTLELPFEDADIDPQAMQVHRLYRLSQVTTDPPLPPNLGEEAREFLQACLRVDPKKRLNTLHLKMLKFLRLPDDPQVEEKERRSVVGKVLLRSNSDHKMDATSQWLSTVLASSWIPVFLRSWLIRLHLMVIQIEGWDREDAKFALAFQENFQYHSLCQTIRALRYAQPVSTTLVLLDKFSMPFPDKLFDQCVLLVFALFQILWAYVVWTFRADDKNKSHWKFYYKLLLFLIRMSVITTPVVMWNQADAFSIILILLCPIVGNMFPTILESWMFITMVASSRLLKASFELRELLKQDESLNLFDTRILEEYVPRIGVMLLTFLLSVFIIRSEAGGWRRGRSSARGCPSLLSDARRWTDSRQV